MDRGLLLALMALQKEFITRQQFLVGFRAWLMNRFLKLEEILVQRAFLTTSQLERLSADLSSIHEHFQNVWQLAIKDNQAVKTVYDDMLTIAVNNPEVMQFVKMIGEAMSSLPTEISEKTRKDSHCSSDPHSTIDSEFPLDPYATLTTQKFDGNE